MNAQNFTDMFGITELDENVVQVVNFTASILILVSFFLIIVFSRVEVGRKNNN